MGKQPFVVTPEAYDRPLNVVGTKVTVLASNEATGGYGITYQQGDEGTGPPPHSHDWDEAFFVLSGSVNFQCGEEQYECDAGTLVHVPRNTTHGFNYGDGGGSMLEITSRDSKSAEMFTQISNTIDAKTRIFRRRWTFFGLTG